MFAYKTTIKMYEIDAAGILFFANQFKLVHDAFEAFLEAKGFTLKNLLTNASFLLPVVHAETDFKAPLRVGDKVVIKLFVKKVGNTSFSLGHEIYKDGTELTGRGETIHVCIAKNTGHKVPLTAEIREILGNTEK